MLWHDKGLAKVILQYMAVRHGSQHRHELAAPGNSFAGFEIDHSDLDRPIREQSISLQVPMILGM